MWQPEMIMILRYMIGDTDCDNYKYTDDRLSDLLVNSALLTNREVNFPVTYTIRPIKQLVSPDPTDEATRDDDFIALVCLKAAIILTRGEFKVSSNSAIMFKNRETQIDLNNKVLALKAAAEAFEEQYESARWYYQLEQRSVGRAILGSLNLPFNYQGVNYGAYRYPYRGL